MDIRSFLKKPASQSDAAVSVPVARKDDAQPSQSNIELEAQSTRNFIPLDTNQPDDIVSQLNTDINCETQSSNSSFPPETCQADDEVVLKYQSHADPGSAVSSASASFDSKPLPPAPYQSAVSLIPIQTLKNRKLKFQQKWFDKFSWLHFDTVTGSVLCHICVTTSQENLLGLAKRSDEAFHSKGFKNWKKAYKDLKPMKRVKCIGWLYPPLYIRRKMIVF